MQTHQKQNCKQTKSNQQTNQQTLKVLATTEGFMSKVRSWSAPARQLSRRPTVAGTDKLSSLIFIRSDPCVFGSDWPVCIYHSECAHAHIITAFKILTWTAPKYFSPNPPTQVQVKLCPGVSQHHTIQPWCSALWKRLWNLKVTLYCWCDLLSQKPSWIIHI